MSQDIRQWLAEIKGLQQKLVEVQQERDQAYISAANWRNLYETEARQRRTEIQVARETIDALKIELETTQPPAPDAINYDEFLYQQVEQWQKPEDLKAQLLQALLDRDQLTQALEESQQAHRQTRRDLTTALGDTMDLLAKAKQAGHSSLDPNHPLPPNVVLLRQPDAPPPPEPVAKTPSPERPQPDLPRFQS
jgi:hypothetical protein